MIVPCVRSCIGTIFEGAGSFKAQIIRTASNKCKESVSLENTSHVETYVIHIDGNKIKIMHNFCLDYVTFVAPSCAKKSFLWMMTKQMASYYSQLVAL